MNKIKLIIKKWSKFLVKILSFLIFSALLKSFISQHLNNLNLNIDYLNIQKDINCTFQDKLNNKIKLGILAYTIKNGGRAKITALLINYFYKKRIFDIYLFTKTFKTENEYQIPKEIKRITIKNKFDYIIKKHNLDILIYEYDDPNEIMLLNNMTKPQVIFYQHASTFYWIYKNFSLFKDLYSSYRSSKYVISMIPFEANYLLKIWGINSIMMENFVSYKYENIIKSDLSKKIILMFGRGNDKLKRFDLGINAMEYISKDICDSYIYIITNMTYSSNLKNLVSNLNLENYIKFFDFSTIPEIYFKNISLNYFLSITESFGLVLCETKMYGIPNILMGIDYTLISKGGTYIIFDEQPETLAKVSINILKNHSRLKILSNTARRSLKRFNNHDLINKWVKVILYILNGIELKTNLSISIKNYKDIIYRQLILLGSRVSKLKIKLEHYSNFTYLLEKNV